MLLIAMMRLCWPALLQRTAIGLVGMIAVSALASDRSHLPVTIASPERASASSQELRLTGTVVASQSTRVSPRVDGLVRVVNVDAGARVSRGDVLLELDSVLAVHALRRAEADTARTTASLAEAERLLAEARPLIEKKHLPRTELNRRDAAVVLAKAERRAALAAEAEARELVVRHKLTAPFDGVIVRKETEVGEWVTRGTPVLRLTSTAGARLDVRAPQERFGDFTGDTTVDILSEALGGQTIAGRILSTVPVSDTETRSFLIRVVASSSATPLMPGSSAVAVFRFRNEKESLLVPRDALSRHPDGAFSVFGVDPGQDEPIAKRFNIRAGRTIGDRLEVLSGLPEGVSVVVRGNELLKDGQSVKITNKAE